MFDYTKKQNIKGTVVQLFFHKYVKNKTSIKTLDNELHRLLPTTEEYRYGLESIGGELDKRWFRAFHVGPNNKYYISHQYIDSKNYDNQLTMRQWMDKVLNEHGKYMPDYYFNPIIFTPDTFDAITEHTTIIGEFNTVEAPLPGCIDPFALNYNPNATQDDGSCMIKDKETGMSTGSKVGLAAASLGFFGTALYLIFRKKK